MRIIYFGSFQHYSALILESLITNPNIEVMGVITTPPMPIGRKQIITKTPVHQLAETHHLPVITPETLNNDNLNRIINLGSPPDFFITAGYGKILPPLWLKYPSLGALNLHFSLLPAFRGANPAEWAIMCGETKTGISLITMSDKLDGGDVIEQRELPITPTDTRESLYHKLYTLGAKELPEMLIRYQERVQKNQFPCQQSLAPKPQPNKSPTPYAALLKRQDGFIPWETFIKTLKHQPLTSADFPGKQFQTALIYLEKSHQRVDYQSFFISLPKALATYPSLWTIAPTIKGDKRMKIISITPLTVQLEGSQSTIYNQIKNQIK